jgi:hypothetical protein
VILVDCPVNITEAPVAPLTAPEIVAEPAVGGGVGVVAALVTVKVADVKCENCGLMKPKCAVVASFGTVTLIKVSLTMWTLASCAAPIHTCVNPVKPVPGIVMMVPGGPEAGEKPEGIGVVRAVALIALVAVNTAKTKDKAVDLGISHSVTLDVGKPRRDH